MTTIDYSRFRFRIGDKVLYNGESVEIAAYYFSLRYNDYTRFGYTIKRKADCYHNGSMSSYDEYGTELSFDSDNYYHIIESDANPDPSMDYSRNKKPKSTLKDFSNAKPGDKVRVKDLDMTKTYQYSITSEMKYYKGKEFTIETIKKEHNPTKELDFPANYNIRLKEVGWSWSDAMLELVTDEKLPLFPTIKKAIVQTFKSEPLEIKIKVKKPKANIKFNF